MTTLPPNTIRSSPAGIQPAPEPAPSEPGAAGVEGAGEPRRRRRFRLRRRDERGVALVEAAIVIPLLLSLVLGLAEFGLMFRQYLTTANASRAGARVGSSAGTATTADYDILQAIAGAAASLPNGALQYVVVFKSTGPNSAVPPLCIDGTPVSGVCNVYPAADLALDSTALQASGRSLTWLPATRQTRQSLGTDWLGVYVRSDYDYLTNMFSGSRPLNDTTIMRLEPESN